MTLEMSLAANDSWGFLLKNLGARLEECRPIRLPELLSSKRYAGMLRHALR